MNLDLSLVLPAFNEEAIIANVVTASHDFLSTHARRFEIIVVDDGSKDATSSQAEGTGRDHVKVVRHSQNRGYGEALRSGFNTASLEWILLMDADGQFRVDDVAAFRRHINEGDMIVGKRERRNDPLSRSMFTAIYVGLVNRLFNLRLIDFTCGFKLFRTAAWKQCEPAVARDHKIFTVEWLWRARQKELRIIEHSVHHYPRTTGQATGATGHVMLSTFRELFRFWRFARGTFQ